MAYSTPTHHFGRKFFNGASDSSLSGEVTCTMLFQFAVENIEIQIDSLLIYRTGVGWETIGYELTVTDKFNDFRMLICAVSYVGKLRAF